jgi:hypothetical protein
MGFHNSDFHKHLGADISRKLTLLTDGIRYPIPELLHVKAELKDGNMYFAGELQEDSVS